MAAVLLLILLLTSLGALLAKTSIKVTSNYKKEVNIKVQGVGLGGCDIVLQPGQTSTDCSCVWGSVHNVFCAYTPGFSETLNATSVGNDKVAVAQGKCPIFTGESLVCSDLTSLANCNDGGYACTVDSTGLCHCSTA